MALLGGAIRSIAANYQTYSYTNPVPPHTTLFHAVPQVKDSKKRKDVDAIPAPSWVEDRFRFLMT